MLDLRKVRLVATFELAEALRSRLVAFVLVLYGVGAAIGAWLFLQALVAAEGLARSTLTENLSVPDTDVPEDLIRQQALPGLISSLVSDPALKDQLLRMDPLAIFYGFMALNVVSGLVLMTSAGAHAGDLSTGAARFVLPRCDRLSWALGKTLGHAALLGIGLLAGAAAAAAVAAGSEAHFELRAVFGLLRTSLWAWIYGACYVGIFSAVSLVAGQPARARTLGLLTLFGLWLCWKLLSVGVSPVPGVEWLAWLFPGQYEQLLWSPNVGYFLLAAAALLALGSAWFALGYTVFARRDA